MQGMTLCAHKPHHVQSLQPSFSRKAPWRCTPISWRFGIVSNCSRVAPWPVYCSRRCRELHAAFIDEAKLSGLQVEEFRYLFNWSRVYIVFIMLCRSCANKQ